MSTSQHNRIAIGVCLFMLIVGVFGVVSAWGAYFTDSRLAVNGPRATGTVIKKEFLRAADGDSDHLVIYRFILPSGQTITSQRGLSKARWDELSPGAPLVVVYSASNPKRNFPEGTGVTSLAAPIAVTLLFGAIALLGGVCAFQLLKRKVSDDAA